MLIGDTTVTMYPGILFIIGLAILYVARIITFFVYESKRRTLSRLSTKAQYSRYSQATIKGSKIQKHGSNTITEVAGDKLCVGDIVKFKKYDSIPCDCIALAASDKLHTDYICYVDNTMQNGTLERKEKISSSLTKSFTHLAFKETTAKQFLKRITGKIDIFRGSVNRKDIVGTIKLTSDPKVEELTQSNVLYRGSIVRSRFCYGLVIATGSDCSTLNSSSIIRDKTSSIHRSVTMFSIISISINIVMSLISMMTMFVRTRENEILKQLDPNLLNGLKIFTFLVLYCPVVPFTILVMIEISNVLYARRIQSNYKGFKTSDEYQTFILSDQTAKPRKTSHLVTKRMGNDSK